MTICGHQTGQWISNFALIAHGNPDAIILDIGMADLTGYEVARRLQQETWAQNVLIVAMTGWGQAKDKERATAAGFDRNFTKPLDPGELQSLLGAFVERKRRT